MGRQRCLPCARRGFLTGWRESEAIQRRKREGKQPINKKGVEFNNALFAFLFALALKQTKSQLTPVAFF